MLYIIYQNQGFKPQIEYAFNAISTVYGTDYQVLGYNELPSLVSDHLPLVISYGKQKPPDLPSPHIHIYESDLFGEDYLQPKSMPACPVPRFNELPVVYRGHGNFDGFVRKSDNHIETNIDIIAATFFMLTRYEEAVRETRDEFGRFPARASLAYQENFLNCPIVNEYIELLWSWIHSLAPEIRRKPLWSPNKEFAVCLTHDVDEISRYSLSRANLSTAATKALSREPLAKRVRWACSLAWSYLKFLLHLERDPYDTIDYILKVEGKYHFKSSFYFMACRPGAPDMAYSVNEPKVANIIRKIEDVGGEVGLHGSYDSYNDAEKMAEEKNRLDGVVINANYGCRQHYLRWKTPDTWEVQSKAGLLYDTTLGFPDNVGFRCGICLPFQPFDIVANRVIDIWELPLVVMERSFSYPDYQSFSFEEGYREIVKCIDTVKKFNGVFVLLWHNSFFPSADWMSRKETFEAVLNYINGQNAWVTNGREIIKYFHQRPR